jgi:hypothetical protein
MNTTPTLLGIEKPGDQLVICNLTRIQHLEITSEGLFDGQPGPIMTTERDVPLNAWEGVTVDGHHVHVSYQIGELTIQVDVPTATGGRSPLTVMRWKPRVALALIAPLINGTDITPNELVDKTKQSLNQERVLMCQANAELAEIRAFNAQKSGLVSTWDLHKWIHDHNRHFPILKAHNLAGSRLRFRTDSLSENIVSHAA